MNKRIAAVFVIGSWVVVSPLQAHEHPKPVPPTPEFQQLQALEGTWKGTSTPMGSDQKAAPITAEFHSTASGSAIEETLMRGTPEEMVDMYTMQGGKVAMTHYCAMGNQPHMVQKSAGPHQIALEMVPTPGIPPNSSHMHALTLEFPDADHLTEHWTNYSNGKAGETVFFNMTRVK